MISHFIIVLKDNEFTIHTYVIFMFDLLGGKSSRVQQTGNLVDISVFIFRFILVF